MKTLFCIFLKIKNQKQRRGWGCSSVTECLPNTYEALGSSLDAAKTTTETFAQRNTSLHSATTGKQHHNDCEEASFHLGREGQLLVKYSLGCPGVSQASFCLFSSPERRVVASWREDLPFGHHEKLRQTGVALSSLFGQVMEGGLNCQLLTTHTCEDACPTHPPQATLWKAGGFSHYR